MCGSDTPFGFAQGRLLSVVCALDFGSADFRVWREGQTRRVHTRAISGQTPVNAKLFVSFR
jgi:hypothetical protein